MLAGLRYRNLTHLQQQSRRHPRQVGRKLKTMIHPRPRGRDVANLPAENIDGGLSAPAWARRPALLGGRGGQRSIRARVGATLVETC